jgi:hypothetical protein
MPEIQVQAAGSVALKGGASVELDKVPGAQLAWLVAVGVRSVVSNARSDAAKTARDSATAAKLPEPTTTELDTLKAEAEAELIAAIYAGTAGTSARGPRGTAVETIARRIATEEVKAILKAHGLVQPAKGAKIRFADGQEFSLTELVGRRLEQHGERLQAAAEAEAARSAEAAEAGGADVAEALGL